MRHVPRAEREAVERDGVGGRALARNRERGARGVGLADPDDAGGEGGERVQVRGVDRQAGNDLGSEVALGGTRRRSLHAALRGTRPHGDRVEGHGGHLHPHVGHEAILIRLARDRDPHRREAKVAHDELVLPTAVGEKDGKASPGVRGALTRHLGFERRRLNDGSRQRLAVGPSDAPGDDIGGRADLGRAGERRAERAEGDEQPAERAWHHSVGSGAVHGYTSRAGRLLSYCGCGAVAAVSYTRRKSILRPRPPSKLTIT